jgi:hypothetical protein
VAPVGCHNSAITNHASVYTTCTATSLSSVATIVVAVLRLGCSRVATTINTPATIRANRTISTDVQTGQCPTPSPHLPWLANLASGILRRCMSSGECSRASPEQPSGGQDCQWRWFARTRRVKTAPPSSAYRLLSDQLSDYGGRRPVHSGTHPRTEFTPSSGPRRLSDRASHRRGHWFEPSIAHQLFSLVRKHFKRFSVGVAQHTHNFGPAR